MRHRLHVITLRAIVIAGVVILFVLLLQLFNGKDRPIMRISFHQDPNKDKEDIELLEANSADIARSMLSDVPSSKKPDANSWNLVREKDLADAITPARQGKGNNPFAQNENLINISTDVSYTTNGPRVRNNGASTTAVTSGGEPGPFQCTIPVVRSDLSSGECKLPVLDPFHPDVMKYIHKQVPAECPGKLYVTYENGWISVDQQEFKKSNVTTIHIRGVRRPNRTDGDFDHILDENAITLSLNNTKAQSKDDFIRVSTKFQDGEIQADLLASVVENPDVLKRTKSKDAQLDIMILGFDSMSAANFERTMPLTFKYLKDELNTFLFKGFSIVGQATTPALSAMLTGLSVTENCQKQEGRTGVPGAKRIDGWPFIFKELKRQGFATMWSEDDPRLGTFHIRLLGFAEPPIDHYARSAWYAHETYRVCFGSQPEFDIQLKYLKSFMKSYKGRRKFGFTFLSDLCHQTISHVGVSDKSVAASIKSINEEGLLDNTMFIVMGDHGPRFAGTRHTTQGKLEESLPFLSVHLPGWFKSKYAKEVTHLKENTNILMSPFDLHASFLHLLNFHNEPERFRKFDFCPLRLLWLMS